MRASFMNSEQNTLPDNQTLLEAIKNLHQEMTAKFEQIDARFGQTDANFSQVDARFEQMRLQMMSFDVRIDRLEAASHELLNIAFNTRADVKVLREEVRAWSKDVAELQQRVA